MLDIAEFWVLDFVSNISKEMILKFLDLEKFGISTLEQPQIPPGVQESGGNSRLSISVYICNIKDTLVSITLRPSNSVGSNSFF